MFMRVGKTAMLLGIAAASTGCVLGTSGMAQAVTASSAGHSSAGVDSHQVVNSFLRSQPASIGASAADGYQLVRTTTSPDGTSHFRYERTYRSLPVVGGDFVIHVKNGKVVGQSGSQHRAIALPTTPKVAAATSRTHAISGAGNYNVSGATKPELVVDVTGAAPVLAWRTIVTGIQSDGSPSQRSVLVNASNGKVIRASENVATLVAAKDSRAASVRAGHRAPSLTPAGAKHAASVPTIAKPGQRPLHTAKAAAAETATGKTTFYGDVDLNVTAGGAGNQLIDPDRGDGSTCNSNHTGSTYSGTGDTCTQVDSSGTTFGDGTSSDPNTEAADAQFAVAQTWDYYKDTFNRTGIFDDGKGVASHVHFGEQGWLNAAWNGEGMVYGDGGSKGSMVALDVAGHEMTHGVSESNAKLGYSGDVGGINESTSDVFGTMVEFQANNSYDKPDFLIGETIDMNGDGSPLRWMDDPSKDGSSISCWSSSTADEDPHYTSGVGNHAFFLMSNGSGTSDWGDSPTCDNSTVTGIGADKAANIWYNAIKDYGTSDMSYADLKAGMVKSADSLYGANSTESQAVSAAWSAVDVS